MVRKDSPKYLDLLNSLNLESFKKQFYVVINGFETLKENDQKRMLLFLSEGLSHFLLDLSEKEYEEMREELAKIEGEFYMDHDIPF